MSEPGHDGPLRGFADWAVKSHDFSHVARGRAVDAIIDTLGCMAAGATDPVVTGLRAAYVSGLSPAGEAELVGGGRAFAGQAALINGTAAHALDYDDNFRPARAHASAVLVPALLAISALRRCSGAEFVSAYIVGLEAQAYIGNGVNNAHNLAGWHPTGTVAAIGAAAGVARLIGLDSAGIAAAMANAVSMAAGVKAQFGTAMKPVHAGLAARAAVEAASLAKAGVHGNPGILDHPAGFRALYAGADGPGWPLSMRIGEPLAIESEGLVPKLHPCCGSAHYVLDMIYDLRRAHGFSATDVAAVESEVGPANYDNLPYHDPQDEMQARFSMPYCVALALLQDRLDLGDFTPAAIVRPDVRQLLPLTTMHRGAGSAPAVPHRLTVKLRNGESLRAERSEVRGSIVEPFSAEETKGKFVSCLSQQGVSETDTARSHSRLLKLDQSGELANDLFCMLFPARELWLGQVVDHCNADAPRKPPFDCSPH